MWPSCETRIVAVSPKDGLTNSRVSHQLVPLLAAGEGRLAELFANNETHSCTWRARAWDSEELSTQEVV
jgi:hypothetical protein